MPKENEVNPEQTLEVVAELTCLLNGVLIGAAVSLILNSQHVDKDDKFLEKELINYLVTYTSNLVSQGLSRHATGVLWAQMRDAADANIENNVQATACHLLGYVLEHGLYKIVH
jgi:hypothetical protein